MESINGIPLGQMLSRLRSNDPNRKLAVMDNSDRNHLAQIVSALQTNTFIEHLKFCFVEEEDGTIITQRELYAPLLNWIRTRTQLKELSLHDYTKKQDMSEFLRAASENTSLEILSITGIFVYSIESLGVLRSHPNLKQICFTMDTRQVHSERVETIGQIISTCPQLHTLQLFSCYFTQENWKPLCDAMYHVPHSKRLTLDFSSCRFDAESTLSLRNILQECPNPVHLKIEISLVQFTSSSDFNSKDPSWLACLVGPSVQALTINYGETEDSYSEYPYVKPCLTNLMDNCRHSLQKLDLMALDSEDDYQAILEGIPNLVSLKEIKISFVPSKFERNTGFFHLKNQMIKALSYNMSITKVDLQNCYYMNAKDKDLTWAISEIEQLHYLRRRNSCFSTLTESPESISICAWPMVLQAVPNTAIGTNFIFQSMRNITGMLPQTTGMDDYNDPTNSCCISQTSRRDDDNEPTSSRRKFIIC